MPFCLLRRLLSLTQAYGNFDMTITQSLQERARGRIPGMTQLLSKRPDMFSLGVWPAYYSRAKGSTVWDADGKEYLDYIISMKTVDSVEEAIAHINRYNTGHSETIVTENEEHARKFLDELISRFEFLSSFA